MDPITNKEEDVKYHLLKEKGKRGVKIEATDRKKIGRKGSV